MPVVQRVLFVALSNFYFGGAEDFFPGGVGFAFFRERGSAAILSSPEFDGAIRAAGDGLILSMAVHAPLTTKRATRAITAYPCAAALGLLAIMASATFWLSGLNSRYARAAAKRSPSPRGTSGTWAKLAFQCLHVAVRAGNMDGVFAGRRLYARRVLGAGCAPAREFFTGVDCTSGNTVLGSIFMTELLL